VVIFTSVRNNNRGIGFLEVPNRVNVAFTRARHALIIVGSIETLSIDLTWRGLLETFERDMVIVNSYDEAEQYLNMKANETRESSAKWIL
jgi:superfamily I DNA and/or RNA helicase